MAAEVLDHKALSSLECYVCAFTKGFHLCTFKGMQLHAGML